MSSSISEGVSSLGWKFDLDALDLYKRSTVALYSSQELMDTLRCRRTRCPALPL